MALYAQHGYGKSDKITRGLRDGLIDGVILSPRDETPANLTRCAQELREDFPDADILIDPQFYATTIVPGRLGHLPEYNYFQSGLTRRDFVSPARVRGFVASTLEFQVKMAATSIVSPSLLMHGFDDPWSQVALSMAQESVDSPEILGGRSLLISLIISEAAVHSAERIREYLDLLTMIEADGFYVVVLREEARYQPHMDPQTLENLLYLVFVLSELSGYRVVVGYADVLGILLCAVGAHGVATGWHNGLRRFTLRRFQEVSGGRRARPRYTSVPLLSSILTIPELSGAADVGLLQEVLSGTDFDRLIGRDPTSADWPSSSSTLHHWACIQQLLTELGRQGAVGGRLDLVGQWIKQARELYASLQSSGVVFDYGSGPDHLDQWQTAIRNFRGAVNV